MLASAFDFGEELNNRQIRYYLHKTLWDRFDYHGVNLDFHNWNKLKYLNEAGTGLSTEIETIPSDRGGLYLFYVKCQIIPGITEYPMYIGRAQFTSSQNLKKRVKEYWQHYSRQGERPKITRMIRYWGSELYLAYLTLDENDAIIDLEKQIINSTLFEMNDQIPDTEVKQAISAF